MRRLTQPVLLYERGLLSKQKQQTPGCDLQGHGCISLFINSLKNAAHVENHI